MIIGYRLGGNASNDGVFFKDAPEGILCPNCGTCLDPNYYPQEIEIHRSKKYDVGYTWDLRTLFSQKFVDFCKNEFDFDMSKNKIKSPTGDLFYYLPDEKVEFDAEERKTKFLNQCLECGNFEEVIGATPVFLKDRSIIESGIFRTDLEFASRSSKSPMLIIGVNWYKKLKKENFRGLYMEPILDDPWVEINKRLAKQKK